MALLSALAYNKEIEGSKHGNYYNKYFPGAFKVAGIALSVLPV